jgi:hypothetical protein
VCPRGGGPVEDMAAGTVAWYANEAEHELA